MTENRLAPRYGQPDIEYFRRMAETPPDRDGPVFMVNLMKYREVADYADGRGDIRSGREADNEYTPAEILRDIGAEIVFAADVERQLVGETPKWDRIGIVKYPSRKAFIKMQTRQDFRAKHVHKEAGMERTIVIACLPMPVPELPEPPTVTCAEGDRPFVMMHVMKYGEAGPAGMAEYSATAGAAGIALGVRPYVRLRAERTAVGDGRQWDEVHFNRFPNHAIFDELRANQTHKAGQPVRKGALEDSYSLMLIPIIDRLAAAIRD
ncbi:MAG: hypothetical protein ABIQ47_02835 [Tepidiformaceae bacterium]